MGMRICLRIDAKDWEAEEYLAEFDDMTDEDVIDDRDE